MTTVGGVVPAHNQVRWIEEAVSSLLAEVDELVVVDDASSDGTTEILLRLSAEHGFVLIVNETAEGVSAACNAGAKALSADVVLLQGGDDRTRPGRRDRSLTALRRRGVSLAYSRPIVIDSHGGVLPDEVAGEFVADPELGDPLPYLFDRGNFICAPSVAVVREDYLSAGGFPCGIDLLQDYALWLDLAVKGRFERVDEPLVEYRKHSMNLSREYTGVDTARRRRHAAELAWIRNRFLDRVDVSTLSRIAHTPATLDEFDLDRDEMALLTRIGHSDRALVRRGQDDLFTRVAAEGTSVLKRFGLERCDVDRLASLADHDNLAELGRAAATVRALTRRPSDLLAGTGD